MSRQDRCRWDVMYVLECLIDYLIKEEILKLQYKQNYLYSITVFTEKLITLGTLCVIFIFRGKAVLGTTFVASFIALRERTGGFHLSSFGRCFCVLIIEITIAALGFWLKYRFYKYIIMGITLCAILIIIAKIKGQEVKENEEGN